MVNKLSYIVRWLVYRVTRRSPSTSHYGRIEDWIAYYQSKRKKHSDGQKDNNLKVYPRVSILILTYNNLLLTQLCLESIYVNTSYPDFEVIVVDNASTDDTPTWLTQYAQHHTNLRFILNSENKGFAGGNNQAAIAATGEFLIFLNNDTVVTSGWIKGLLRHIEHDSQIGLIGPVTNSTGNEAKILSKYDSPSAMEKFAKNRSQNMAGKYFDIRMLAFFCVMTRKDQYESFGGLDERYAVGMFEDDDLAVQYHQAGYKVVCAEDVFIHHFQEASFGKLEMVQYSKIFEENRRKYEKKWGRKWEPYQLRPEVMRDLQKDWIYSKRNNNILLSKRMLVIFGLLICVAIILFVILLLYAF